MSWTVDPSKDSTRFLRLVNALDHAVVWEFDDTDQRYTFVSDHSRVVLGYDSDAWATDPHHFERCIVPEDLPGFIALIAKLRDGEANDLRLEHRCLTAQGSVTWVHTGVHRADEAGHCIFRGVTIDVHGVKTAEERERAAKEHAERAVRHLEEVMAIVSHDVRGPLSTLLMGVEALEVDSTDIPKTVVVIRRAAQRLARLIDDLVDLSSIRSQRLRVVATESTSRALLDECLDEVAAEAENKSISLVQEPGPELTVRCDPKRIAQVLSNLLNNALKFSHDGGSIEVGAKADALEVVFWVRDSGVGIPQGSLSRVFDRHWQAPATADQGQGLGLFISKGIVEAHGGRIWAESEVGRGTTFRFALPLTGH
jgi:signal transduction histidine kinase